MKNSLINKFVWITLYSIAMGLLECAVVIYIREIYYPNGFYFPMKPINPTIGIVEISRELATLIMLISIAAIAGKNFIQRFAWFIFSFAIWDIFYYIFLYIFIGWPNSLFTFDVLFLIPVPWIGPVITPVIVSALMIYLAVVFLRAKLTYKPSWKVWSLLILGSSVTIFSWIYDYATYIFCNYGFNEIWSLNKNRNIFETATTYIPTTFNYYIFALGIAIILFGIIKSLYDEKRKI